MSATVISITNLKGGVAKTTTSANIGAGLARLGYKVLMIDWDPQANLTTHFGYEGDQVPSLYDALDASHEDLFIKKSLNPINITQYPKKLFLLSSNFKLSKFEPIFSSPALGGTGTFTLSNVIDVFTDKVDFVIIDCQPSLSLLTVNAYYASDYLFIPAETGKFSTDGMEQILFSLKRLNKNFKRDTKIGGVFLTRMEPNTTLGKAYAEYLEGREDVHLMDSKIRRNVAIKECQEEGLDIFSYDDQQTEEAKKQIISNGSEDYFNLINEMLLITGKKKKTNSARKEDKVETNTENGQATKRQKKGILSDDFKAFLNSN